MKKTKFYFIVPIIAVIVFSLYYWSFASQYDAKQAQIVAAQRQARLDKLTEEAKQREAAIHDAVEAQKVRKADRLARDAKERQQRDDRENARLEQEKADQEAQKLERQAEKLEKDVAAANEDIAKIKIDQKRDADEVTFLKQYTEAAKANQAKLAEVVAKIMAADAARARADALAAAQAKKS